MADKEMTIKITPQFGLEIGLALKNYAGLILTGTMVGRKGRTVEKAEHFSKLADTFTKEVTQFIIDNQIPHNPEIDNLSLEYIATSISYMNMHSSMYVDTDTIQDE